MRFGTSDSDWQDCDWDPNGKSNGGVMCYSDIDTGTLGYLTTDLASVDKVSELMTDSFTIEAWIRPEYIPLLNLSGTGPEFGFYDPFTIFDIKEWDSEAVVTGDNSLFCLLRFMPNETGLAGRFEAMWYDTISEKELEKIPEKLAQIVANNLVIPVIGIGAGQHVDGQVLVYHDMIGLNQDFHPRFLRRYADLNKIVTEAVQNYIVDVKSMDFPSEDESY